MLTYVCFVILYAHIKLSSVTLNSKVAIRSGELCFLTSQLDFYSGSRRRLLLRGLAQSLPDILPLLYNVCHRLLLSINLFAAVLFF